MKKINEVIGDFGRSIVDFYAYVRNYKNHLDEEEARELEVKKLNEDIIDYEKQIKDLTNDKIGYDDVLKSKDTKISDLKDKLSNIIKEFNSKIDDLSIQLETKDTLLVKESKKVIDLEKKLKEKELKRIASVGTANSKQKKIANLEKEILKLKEVYKEELADKDKAIEFYKSKLPEPTLKDLKNYRYGSKKSSDKYK